VVTESVLPFAPGTVSIRLYPHTDLDPKDMVEELCAQAKLALDLGFDGVMTSEHHGGFAGYLAQPLQMATFVLEENTSGWAAASPMLLPLRATALVAEEVAWLNARHPGRVGLGVAVGALPLDFEIVQLDPSDGVALFKSELPRLVAMLRGEDLRQLDGDAALRACREHPVPVLSAAVSPSAAKRAARCGAGILMEGMSGVPRLTRLSEAYDDAGGTGSKVLIRRVFLGDVQSDLVNRQRAIYNGISNAAAFFDDDETVACHDPDDMVTRLDAIVEQANVDALNLRVHLPGMSPDTVRQQIRSLAAAVVPALKRRWSSGRTARSMPL